MVVVTGALIGAAAKEAIEPPGDQDIPFAVGDGGESGEDVVQVRVVEEVDGRVVTSQTNIATARY